MPLTLLYQTVWVSAGQFLLEELVSLRASRLALGGPASDGETELLDVFSAGFQDMILLAESCHSLK